MIKLLQFRLFQNFRGIGHFISTREGGVSHESYESLNLSLTSGDDEDAVRQNRHLLADRIGMPPENMHFPDQCHSDNIVVLDSKYITPDLTATDGIVTRLKGVCLCILAADCVPVLLYDPVKQVVGAVHSGWKGTVSGIVVRAIERMQTYFGSKPGKIMAGIGPAISARKYEVGEEVIERFRPLFSKEQGVVRTNRKNGKNHIDLQEANRLLLVRTGLNPNRIEVLKTCTFSNPGYFFSARRDGYETGRFAAGIFLRN